MGKSIIRFVSPFLLALTFSLLFLNSKASAVTLELVETVYPNPYEYLTYHHMDQAPWGATIDSSGNVYISLHRSPFSMSILNSTIIKVDPSGNVTQLYTGEDLYRLGNPSPFNNIEVEQLSLDNSGNLIFFDHVSSSVLTMDPSTGAILDQFGEAGSADNQLNNAQGVVQDSTGAYYVANNYNNAIAKYTSAGVFDFSFGGTLYVWGSGDGELRFPISVDVDSNDNVYVSDSGNDRVQVFDSNGNYLRQWGGFSDMGQLVLDDSDNVYVADSTLDNIRKYSSTGTLLGTISESTLFDDYSTESAYVVGTDGTYIATAGKNVAGYHTDLVIWNSAGVPQRVLKTHSYENGGLYKPGEMMKDSSGNFYILDEGNNRIQKFNSSMTYVTKYDYTEDVNDFTVDDSGNLYLVRDYEVQILNAAGAEIATIGSGVLSAADGEFNAAWGIDIDDTYIYISDRLNHRIQKFLHDGTFVSKWGSQGGGDGQMSNPKALKLDDGKIYVQESVGQRLSVFDTDGNFIRNFRTMEVEVPIIDMEIINDYLYVLADDTTTLPEDFIVAYTTAGEYAGIFDPIGDKYDEEYDLTKGVVGDLSGAGGMWLNPDGLLWMSDKNFSAISSYRELYQIIPPPLASISSSSGENIILGSEYGVNGTDIVSVSIPEGLLGEQIIANDFQGGGTFTGWTGDDDEFAYTLPFTFSFYGVDYDDILIGSNGNICFDNTVDCTWFPEYLDVDTEYGPGIVAFGADLAANGGVDPGDGIYIDETVTGQVTIRWQTREYGELDLIQFEVVLFENGNVQINYGTQEADATYGSITVGVTKGDGIVYLEATISGQVNNNYEDSILFSPGEGGLIAGVPVNLSTDVDWSGGSVDIDKANNRVFYDGSVSGNSQYLYVAKDSGHNSVVLCPDALDISEVTTSCTNRVVVYNTQMTTTVYGGITYWKVPLSSVKGAVSTYSVISILEPPDDGEDDGEDVVPIDDQGEEDNNAVPYFSYPATTTIEDEETDEETEEVVDVEEETSDIPADGSTEEDDTEEDGWSSFFSVGSIGDVIRGVMSAATSEDVANIAQEGAILASSTAVLVASPAILGSIYAFLIRLVHGFLVLLGIRSKGREFGYVYDSTTKNPLALVVARIFNLEGTLIETAVTNSYGTFDSSIEEGVYNMTFAKPEYTFPSQAVVGSTDSPIGNIYHGEKLSLSKDNIYNISVPLDSNDLFRNIWEGSKSRISGFLNFIGSLLLVLGSVYSLIMVFKRGDVWDYIILLVYVCSFLLLGYRKISWSGAGTVSKDGEAVDGIRIVLYQKALDDIVDVRYTDSNGRYRFVATTGEYEIRVDDEMYEEVPGSIKMITVKSKKKPGILYRDMELRKKL